MGKHAHSGWEIGKSSVIALGLVAALLAVPAVAQESAAQPVEPMPEGQAEPKGQAEEPMTPEERAAIPLDANYGSETERAWQAFLTESGLHEGQNDGDKVITSGKAVVTVDRGHTAWIQARVEAFANAELQAKAQLVRTLNGALLSGEIELTKLANASFGQGYVQDIKEISQLQRMLAKLADFSEATIDKALAQLVEDYNPVAYEDGSRDRRAELMSQALKRRFSMVTTYAVSGAVPFKVFEGPTGSGDGYEVLVGMIWSPRIMRAVTQIPDERLGMPWAEAYAMASSRMPKTVGEAVGRMGTELLFNDREQRAIIAFGQAQPPTTPYLDQAQEQALSWAEQDALQAIARFLGEQLTVRSEDEVESLEKIYEGLVAKGARITRDSVDEVRAVIKPRQVDGIQTIWRQVVGHPETGQDVAIVAVLWSPAKPISARQGAAVAPAAAADPAPAAPSAAKVLPKARVYGGGSYDPNAY